MGNTIERRRKGGGAEMWRFKGCPKCGGDVFIDYDLNGWYEECLQCGYLRDLKTVLQVREEKPAKAEKKPELALAGHHRKAAHNN
jgi:ribosomal protein S27AE